MPDTHGRIRIAVLNDYEIVVRGVAAALDPFADRIHVVELDSQMPVVSDVDIVLYDTFGQVQGDAVEVEKLRSGDAKLVVFSWNVAPELVEKALARGAAGYLSKGLDAEDLATSIERVCRGEVVVPEGATAADPEAFGRWPGDEHGLSAREAEMIALIVQGLRNQDIAERSYLSINSVKTYIRTAYRKIGVNTRAQAVVWGMGHGFEPDRSRQLEP
ncbi:response regulator transcription factor [Nocardioides sp. KIGAM211]|uniref:Response regulator transcription factor n=1 Tax=Nocardioides luti TaxID=2761101 RepID=A0A7X0VAI4_9ACTN|nr:response regulator transcription factor [Nocardioides luti]MBB6627779.1 response regulator transcription factor [Nocardioides luti]